MDPRNAFEILEMRVGRIVRAEPHEQARRPAYRLWIDFGTGGVRASSAQLTDLYSPEALVGRQVVAAMNLGPPDRGLHLRGSRPRRAGRRGRIVLLATDPRGTRRRQSVLV